MLIVFIVFGWTAGVSADIYAWIDNDGVRRYTNKPPPIGIRLVDKMEEVPFDATADSVRREKDDLEMQQLLEHWRIERQMDIDKEMAAQQREAEALRLQKATYQSDEVRRWRRFYDDYLGPSYVPVLPQP